MVFSYNKAINLDQNRLFLNTKIRRHCASTKCLNGSHYHPWSVSWTTMPARLQTCNWKQRVALGWRGLAATTASGRYSSPGVAAHCQILHLHLCPWTCGSEVLQAMLVGKLHPFKQPFSLWQCWGGSSHGYFCFEAPELQVKQKKEWLLNWWLGSHNNFTSGQCCRLWTVVSVTGK